MVRPSKAMAASIIIPSRLPLPRAVGPDAERLSCSNGGEFRIVLEISAAFRAELRFVPGHADGDTVDIRNLRAAKAKRISATRLLLLLRVSLTCRGPHENRERRAHHQAEMDLSGANKHRESPRVLLSMNCEWRANEWQEGPGVLSQHVVEIRALRFDFSTVVVCGFDDVALIDHALKGT
jgi:hypothetical protein